MRMVRMLFYFLLLFGFIIILLQYEGMTSIKSELGSQLKPRGVSQWVPQEHTSAQQVGGFHNTTLTHVLFTISSAEDVALLRETLLVWWTKFPPCANWNQVLTQCDKDVFPQDTSQRPHLLVLLAPALRFEVSSLMDIVANAPWRHACFATAQVKSLEQSSSDLSLSEIVLRGSCLGARQDLGYALFLSANARPVRANWLTSIALSVLFPVPNYWMIVPFPSVFPKLLNERSTLAIFRLSTHPRQNSRTRTRYVEGDLCVEEFPATVERDTFPHTYFASLRPFARETLLLANNARRNASSIFSLQTYLHYYLFYGFKKNYELVRFNLANRVMVSKLLAETLPVDASDSYAVLAISPPAQFNVTANNTTRLLLPGQHDAQITHVVLAFNNVPRQFARLRNTLTRWWERFPPCRGPGDAKLLSSWRTNCQQAHNNATSPQLPGLVFMVSRRSVLEFEEEALRNDAALEQRVRNEIFPLIPASSKPCFSRISICIVRLSQRADSYLTGSRILFERFLRGECTGVGSDRALYIEPDARPVKPGWLTSISSSVVFPNPPSWIIGSIFQGSEQLTKWNPPPDWIFHFNGNGVYQLKREGGTGAGNKLGLANLPDFYFNRVRPHMVSIQGTSGESAMDIDITTYVMSVFDATRNEQYRLPEQQRMDEYLSKLEFDALLRNIPAERKRNDVDSISRFVTHCRFSNLIVNKYKSRWERTALREEAQIVHGGYCGEECKS